MLFRFIIVIIFILIIGVFYFYTSNKISKYPMGTYTSRHIDVPLIGEPIRAYISLVRHGSRFPTWKVYETLSPQLKQAIPTKRVEGLTERGCAEMTLYGEQLRKYYPQLFNNKRTFKIHSTGVQRAYDSAQCCLVGLGQPAKTIEINNPLLKLKGFFIKGESDPKIADCQFAHSLGLEHISQTKCSRAEILNFERHRNEQTWQSMEQNHSKGTPIANHIRDLIKNGQGAYLHFAHDSTLASLYWNLGLPQYATWSNEEWLPFGARLEIFVLDDGRVLYYVNGRRVSN